MILHVKHSVVDWFAYAIWQDGVLLRSLSVSPGEVFEDIGAPPPFEAPFWAGGRPPARGRGSPPGTGCHFIRSNWARRSCTR